MFWKSRRFQCRAPEIKWKSLIERLQGSPPGLSKAAFLLLADVSTAQAEKIIAMIFPFQEPFGTPGEDGKEAFQNVEKYVL